MVEWICWTEQTLKCNVMSTIIFFLFLRFNGSVNGLKPRMYYYYNLIRNTSTLTRITDWKILCVYIHVYKIIKKWGTSPYNSLRHADNRKCFSGLSLMRNQREPLMFYLAREVGKFWTCSCWEKGNFIMINKFRYGQTWKILPSPLSLSLYSTFKHGSWPVAEY